MSARQAIPGLVARDLGVSLELLQRGSRAPHVVAARRLVVRLYYLAGLPMAQIGELIGRDHSSVFYLLGCECRTKVRPRKDPAQCCPVCGLRYWSGLSVTALEELVCGGAPPSIPFRKGA